MLHSVNPYNGQLLKMYLEMTPDEADCAIATAHERFQKWRTTSLSQRATSSCAPLSYPRMRLRGLRERIGCSHRNLQPRWATRGRSASEIATLVTRPAFIEAAILFCASSARCPIAEFRRRGAAEGNTSPERRRRND